jgi:hypothetical protein
MKLNLNSLLFLLFILFCRNTLFAQITAPKYSNEFLSIGVGGRALGMSNTQTAIVSDVTAGYWNPAGLMRNNNKYQFSLMHAEYFAGIANFDYFGFATPIDSFSHIAVSAVRFAVDDIPDTRFLYDANGAINYDNIRFFSAADYGFFLSYAKKFKKRYFGKLDLRNLSVGGSAKIVHRIAGNFASAWGFGLDAGAQYHTKTWQFGLMIRDITGTFNAWSHNPELLLDTYSQTGNDIPDNSIEVTLPKATFGAARPLMRKKSFGVLAAMDLDLTFDGKRNTIIRTSFVSAEPRIGVEFNYLHTLFLRAGAGNVQRVKNFDGSFYHSVQPNFGLGIQLKKFNIDYAMTNIGNVSDILYSHIFSLKINLKDKQEKEEEKK